ncbi:MAG: DMT family transporter [Beijerinckiaceae bacterium]
MSAAAIQPRPNNIRLVIFWVTGALLAFSAMAVSLRALSPYLGVFEMLTLRNLTGVIVLAALALLNPGLRPLIWPQTPMLHVWRNIVHFIGTYTWSYSVTILPFALVFAIEFTNPIWVTLMAVPFLGERLTPSRIGAVVLGFAGILVITRPWNTQIDPRAVWPLACALFFAATTIFTKKLTIRNQTFTILLWMNILQLPMNLVGADLGFFAKIPGLPLWPLLGVCTCGLISHYCLTNAFQNGDAMTVVPLDFLRIPLIAIVGWQFYSEPLDPFVFAGAALIIVGILWNMRSESRKSQLQK